MSLSSEEVNYLLYRYLLESGFTHSAFTFGNEALITETKVNGDDVPSNSLLMLLQKGLQLIEIEEHLQEDGTLRPCTQKFTLFGQHLCSDKFKETEVVDVGMERVAENMPGKRPAISRPRNDVILSASRFENAKMNVVTPYHSAIVYAMSFKPGTYKVTTGSSDGTAKITDTSAEVSNMTKSPNETILAPLPPLGSDYKQHEITKVSWHPNGELVALSSYEGRATVFDSRGCVRASFLPIGPCRLNSVQWSPNGEYIAACGTSPVVNVFGLSIDVSSKPGDIAQAALADEPHVSISTHSKRKIISMFTSLRGDSVLDICWRDNTTLAAGDSAGGVYFFDVQMKKELRLQGHYNEVNEIGFSPSGDLLASCSDDTTTKLWNVDTSECSVCVFDDSDSPVQALSFGDFLATSDEKGVVRLYDVRKGVKINSYEHSQAPVYALKFAPGYSVLASGGLDQTIRLYDTRQSKCFRKYDISDGCGVTGTAQGTGGVMCIDWSSDGLMLGAGLISGDLVLIDARK